MAKEDLIKAKRYNNGEVECIDAMASVAAGKVPAEGVRAAEIVKYLFRYQDKNGLADLEKAQVYLDMLKAKVKEREGKENKGIFSRREVKESAKLLEESSIALSVEKSHDERIERLDKLNAELPEVSNPHIRLVEQFHKVFGHPIATEPTLIPEERWRFRLKMMRDELDELEKAYEEADIEGILDAYIDLDYFKKGSIIESGMQKIYDLGFTIVHKDNMKKSHTSYPEAVKTCNQVNEQTGEKPIIVEIECDGVTYFNVVDNSNTDRKGKTLKPYNFDRDAAGKELSKLLRNFK